MKRAATYFSSLGEGRAPFIVAELSGNHGGSLEKALQLVDAAAESGADAVKLQTYTADTMTLNIQEGEFIISDPKSLWVGESLHNLYQRAHTPWEWHEPIMDRAKARGLMCFSSPFDDTAVDFLESLEVPIYKVASFEIVDLPLIAKVAATGKPLILSTGMATVSEIAEAVETARKNGCSDLMLLKCTSNYPADPSDSNLSTIPHLREMFGCEVGLSDHTLGNGVAVASVALGASLIEKHFTLSRKNGGVDSSFSMDPAGLRSLREETEEAWKAVGTVHYGPTENERNAVLRRRSLYIAEDLAKGDTLRSENLRRVRPGHGLPTKYYERLLGRKVNQDVKKGTPVSWELIN